MTARAPFRVALATCSELPAWEVDDAPLHAALARRGAVVERPAWDDDAFAWDSVDACVLRTTWDYVPRIDAFRAWLHRVAGATRLLNPLPFVLWNLDKRYLRELEAAGVPVIPTYWVHSADEALGEAWRSWLHGEVAAAGGSNHAWQGFAKPAVGASASGTLRFSADGAGMARAAEHLAAALAESTAHTLGPSEASRSAGAPAPAMLVQPYLPAVESHGEISFIFIAGRFTHAVRKRPVPGDYRVQDDWGGSDAAHQPTGPQIALAERTIEAAQHVVASRGRADAAGAVPIDETDLLYARVDFLDDGQGRLLLTELELVEPSLFFRHCPQAAEAMAEAVEGGGGRGTQDSGLRTQDSGLRT